MDAICVSKLPHRTFMAKIAGGLLAAPRAAGAQQATRVYRIGSLTAGSRGPSEMSAVLPQALKE
jgi:hypothetical protein